MYPRYVQRKYEIVYILRYNVCENFRTNRRRNCHMAFNHCRRTINTYCSNRYLLYTTSVSTHAIDYWYVFLLLSVIWWLTVVHQRREEKKRKRNVIFCRHRNYFSRSLFVSLFFLKLHSRKCSLQSFILLLLVW